MRVFNPHKIPSQMYLMLMHCWLFPDKLENLKAELPSYVAKADDISSELAGLEFWKLNATDFPLWSSAEKILAIQLFSAAAKRVFSLLNLGFSDLQENSLKDYIIEASIMLRYNH